MRLLMSFLNLRGPADSVTLLEVGEIRPLLFISLSIALKLEIL